jgi:lysophospholipase L1-like esterase
MKLTAHFLSLALSSGVCASGAPLEIAALSPRSLVDAGDAARLQHVMAKARRGEKITVAVIGGSITAGASATKPESRYGNRVATWWRRAFPKTEVDFVNAGIGATGSNYAALRAGRDLLARRPDAVVVEFGVNDGNTRDAAETLEGLTRQILRQPNQPAVLLLFMMHEGGGNAQDWHGKVGRHYALPQVSFRDALWPEIKAGRFAWETVMADQVHPNDLGHECAAKFVIALLERVRAALPDDDKLPAIKPVPAPLLSDLFEHTALIEAADLNPVKNYGWSYDARWKNWNSNKPGSAIEFEINGRLVFTMHFVVRCAMGKAKAQVDEMPPATLNGWFDQTWGGYRCTTIAARDLKPGMHRVRFELLAEKSERSEGHKFEILGLGAAGVEAGEALRP